MKIEKDIAIAKARLTAKARRIGLWENFGQKEVLKLESEYECDRSNKLIDDFDHWCMNFDLSDLRGI